MIFATCGHELDAVPESGVWWREINRRGETAWAYGVLCPSCAGPGGPYGSVQTEPPDWEAEWAHIKEHMHED